jgi:arsenite/tail-anchored protein-transporting ATPase
MRPVRVAPRLDAVELDARRVFARWRTRHRDTLADILEHGTVFDRNDAEALVDLPIPGVDELAGLIGIARLSRLRYDVVVVDTAPTGHALRLMGAPATLTAVAEALDGLEEGHRFIRERLAGNGGDEPTDRFIAQLAREGAAASAAFGDPQQTAFIWVLLPERLSIAETEDGLAALARLGVHVPELVVNQVLTDVATCPLCHARQAEQRQMLATVRQSLADGRRVRVVPASTGEPAGVRALQQIGRLLTGVPVQPRTLTRRSVPRRSARAVISKPPSGRLVKVSRYFRSRLIVVGGKGGAGKTTVAAALALELARAARDRKILLLSTDPAPSLADVFGRRIGDAGARVSDAYPNLLVRELDAVRAFSAKRSLFESAIEEMQRTPDSGAAPWETLLDLAPPGIDELFGMLTIVDALKSYDTVVVDAAPTGHMLRMLGMPQTARAWAQALLRLLLKYRGVVRPGRLGAELVDTSRTIRALEAALRERATTQFVVVARAGVIPHAETHRLLSRLRGSALGVGAIVVNARTLQPGRCPRCQRTERRERLEMAAIRPPRDCAIIQTPLAAPPPRGTSALHRWAQTWIT